MVAAIGEALKKRRVPKELASQLLTPDGHIQLPPGAHTGTQELRISGPQDLPSVHLKQLSGHARARVNEDVLAFECTRSTSEDQQPVLECTQQSIISHALRAIWLVGASRRQIHS